MSAPITFDNSYRRLPEGFYRPQPLQPVLSPTLIKANPLLASALNIDHKWLNSNEALEVFAGNSMPQGADPIATVYAGYQFGNWNPQLGDGRALLLGEVIAKEH